MASRFAGFLRAAQLESIEKSRARGPLTAATMVRSKVGGDGGESNSPSRELPAEIYYRLVRRLILATPVSLPAGVPG